MVNVIIAIAKAIRCTQKLSFDNITQQYTTKTVC